MAAADQDEGAAGGAAAQFAVRLHQSGAASRRSTASCWFPGWTGPTPEIASHLVDKALAAETNGLWGRAYFDLRNEQTNDAYYLGDLWLRTGAELCRELGFDVEVDTNAATFPESYPMSHIAIYAGWYDSDVSGPFKLPTVEFMPGAFAYHLHSFSARNVALPAPPIGAARCWPKAPPAPWAACTNPTCNSRRTLPCSCNASAMAIRLARQLGPRRSALSWQTTVIGDPLYQPFQTAPAELHARLARAQNPLIEWSFERLVNLDLARGVREPQLENFLENLPATAQSAVLTEKLAEIYEAIGQTQLRH